MAKSALPAPTAAEMVCAREMALERATASAIVIKDTRVKTAMSACRVTMRPSRTTQSSSAHNATTLAMGRARVQVLATASNARRAGT